MPCYLLLFLMCVCVFVFVFAPFLYFCGERACRRAAITTLCLHQENVCTGGEGYANVAITYVPAPVSSSIVPPVGPAPDIVSEFVCHTILDAVHVAFHKPAQVSRAYGQQHKNAMGRFLHSHVKVHDPTQFSAMTFNANGLLTKVQKK